MPSAGEPDFTFYVAFFGMKSDTNCELWGDGWGRRRQLYVDGRRLGGSDDHDHHDHDNSYKAPTPDASPRRVPRGSEIRAIPGTSSVRMTVTTTATPVSSAAITSQTTRSSSSHRPQPTGPTSSSPSPPTLFKTPRLGHRRLPSWRRVPSRRVGRANQQGPKKFSVGLEPAERDVFAPVNLMTFDHILHDIQTWNGWNGFVLVLPQVLFFLAAFALAAAIKAKKPSHYGTASGYPTPFRLLALLSGAILLGHLIMNLAIFAQAASNAHVNSRELGFPLGMGIVAPLLGSIFTLLIGLGAGVRLLLRGRTLRQGPLGPAAHLLHLRPLPHLHPCGLPRCPAPPHHRQPAPAICRGQGH